MKAIYDKYTGHDSIMRSGEYEEILHDEAKERAQNGEIFYFHDPMYYNFIECNSLEDFSELSKLVSYWCYPVAEMSQYGLKFYKKREVKND